MPLRAADFESAASSQLRHSPCESEYTDGVRKVDDLLRQERSSARGFADPRVVVLDPCCGTAAYLAEVARCIAEDVRARGDQALLAAELLEALSTRVIGFEILTAPFVIARLQLYHVLSEVGAKPLSGQRPAVFLTNALSGWEGPDQIKVNFPELRQEHEAARKVKRDAKIIVILANPPYNRFAGMALEEEADLVDHDKGIRRREKQVRVRARWSRKARAFCTCGGISGSNSSTTWTSGSSVCWSLASLDARLATLLALREAADALYEKSEAAAFTAEELGVRK